MVNIIYKYVTSLTMQECIEKLMCPPMRFNFDWLFSREYEIRILSKNKFRIIFTRGCNLSNHETEYEATFYELNEATIIEMKFVAEKCGMPYPFVSEYEISKLFRKRIGAELV